MLKSSARSIGPCLSLPENPARLAGYALFYKTLKGNSADIFFDKKVPFTQIDGIIDHQVNDTLYLEKRHNGTCRKDTSVATFV